MLCHLIKFAIKFELCLTGFSKPLGFLDTLSCPQGGVN